MAKTMSRLNHNNYDTTSNIGLGLVGGAIAQNQCLQSDNSMYCQLSRTYSSFIMILSIFAIIYILIRLFKTRF